MTLFSCKQDQNNDKIYAVMNSVRALYINFQKSNVSNDDYLKEIQARWVRMFHCLLEDEMKYNKEVKYATKVELKTARENVQKKTSTALLLIGADC